MTKLWTACAGATVQQPETTWLQEQSFGNFCTFVFVTLHWPPILFDIFHRPSNVTHKDLRHKISRNLLQPLLWFGENMNEEKKHGPRKKKLQRMFCNSNFLLHFDSKKPVCTYWLQQSKAVAMKSTSRGGLGSPPRKKIMIWKIILCHS